MSLTGDNNTLSHWRWTSWSQPLHMDSCLESWLHSALGLHWRWVWHRLTSFHDLISIWKFSVWIKWIFKANLWWYRVYFACSWCRKMLSKVLTSFSSWNSHCFWRKQQNIRALNYSNFLRMAATEVKHLFTQGGGLVFREVAAFSRQQFFYFYPRSAKYLYYHSPTHTHTYPNMR